MSMQSATDLSLPSAMNLLSRWQKRRAVQLLTLLKRLVPPIKTRLTEVTCIDRNRNGSRDLFHVSFSRELFNIFKHGVLALL